ncbi:MAG: Lrp/AsnC family transcriptional regulator [Acidilobaceae archaeon]
MRLNPFAEKLLMKLQYEFPLSLTPYLDVAEELNASEKMVLTELKRLVEAGIVKRVGFYYNYRSKRQSVALIGVSCKESYRSVGEITKKDPLTTHSYLRDHPEVNLWVVARRGSREELISYAEELAKACNSSKYTVLFSKKTFKLSVKFDLIEGVSRSGPYSSVAESPPKPEDLGIDPRLPEMVRSLPLENRPYKTIAERLNMREDEVLESLLKLLKNGILGDPGVALDGKKLGFSENAMIVVRVDGSEEKMLCLASIPYTTHVVLREVYPPGSWDFDGYAMVHATSRDKINKVINEISSLCSLAQKEVLFSIEDLKPEVVR